MVNILTLVNNEFIKNIKKTSTKIILSSALIFGIILPMFINYMDNREDEYQRALEWEIEYFKEEIGYLEEESNDANKLRIELLEEQIEFIEGIQDYHTITYDDYRINLYYMVLDSITEVKIYEALENYDDKIIAEVYTYGDIYQVEAIKEYDEDKINDIKSKIQSYKTILENNDYNAYLEMSLVDVENEISDLSQSMLDLRETLEETEDEKQKISIEEEIKIYEERLTKEKGLEKLYNELLGDDKVYEHDSYEVKTINYMVGSIYQIETTPPTKEVYQQEMIQYYDMSYEEYLEKHKKNLENFKEEMEIYYYSLVNEVPQLMFSEDARNSVDEFIEFGCIFATVVVLIIGGGQISSEISSGTIRLLLTRPVKRSRILASKIITTLRLGVLTFVLYVIPLVIVSGLIFGFDGYYINILEYVNGEVVEVNFFVYIIKDLLFFVLTLIFMTMFSVMLSILIKNTAFSVAGSVVLYLGSPIITILAISSGIYVLQHNIFSYVSYPFIDVMGLNYTLNNYGFEYNTLLGSGQLIIAAVVSLVITIVYFKKIDINN